MTHNRLFFSITQKAAFYNSFPSFLILQASPASRMTLILIREYRKGPRYHNLSPKENVTF